MKKTEIERKFLIENVGGLGFDIKKFEKKRLVQAYISTSPTIRLRNEGGAYALCVKSQGGLSREEFELEISEEQFERLWVKAETSAVTKDRYFIPLENGLVAELDVYLGGLSGLATVEVEFSSECEAELFSPPEWFGEDVTHDHRYKNTSLATKGLPARL